MDRMTKWTIFAGACAAAFCIWLRVLRTMPGAAGPATLRELLGELGGGLALFVVTLAEFATFDSPVSVPVLAAAAVTGLLIVFVLPLAQGLLPFALAGSDRRRHRRRGPGPGHGPAGRRAAAVHLRWHSGRKQPAGRANDDHYGGAVRALPGDGGGPMSHARSAAW
jgi:hypothetical protein